MSIRVKRGTKANLDAVATQGGFLQGEPLLVTDQNRLAVATSTNTYEPMAKLSEASSLQWVNFNGSTMTIRGSSGITSISAVSTGVYQINFAAKANTNYGVLVTKQNSNNTNSAVYEDIVNRTTTSCRIICIENGTTANSANITVQILG